MKEGKRAQFYIISAVVIIFVLVGLAVVTNYATVKEEPKKFYDLADTLKLEGIKVVEYAEYNPQATTTSTAIQQYVALFDNYTRQNPEENINFVIIYGDIVNNEVRAFNYSVESSGGVGLNLGSSQPGISGSGDLRPNDVRLQVNPDNTVDVTLTSGNNSIITTVPVFGDNNFAFVLTTSQGLNDYIISNLDITQRPSGQEPLVTPSAANLIVSSFENTRNVTEYYAACSGYRNRCYYVAKIKNTGSISGLFGIRKVFSGGALIATENYEVSIPANQEITLDEKSVTSDCTAPYTYNIKYYNKTENEIGTGIITCNNP